MDQMAEMRVFLALARSGSIAEAAALVGRDATALSRRLQSLEARLGARLVARNTRRIALTDEGRAYLDRIAPLVSAIDSADAEIGRRAGGDVGGRIRLALPSAFGRRWMTPILLSFLEAHPRIAMHVDYSDRLVDLVGEGFDLSIRIGELADSGLIVRRLARRRRMVCASPAHPAVGLVAAPADLADHPALCFAGRERQQWNFIDRDGATASVTVRCALSSNNADLLVEAAAAGLGVVNSTDWHAQEAVRDGRLVELLGDWRQIDAGTINLAMPSADPPARVRALVDWIADRLPG